MLLSLIAVSVVLAGWALTARRLERWRITSPLFLVVAGAAVEYTTHGSLADTLYRSPFVCAALCQDKDGLLLTARMPRGRDGMGAVKAIYLPPEGQPGARPPLAPKGVLYSESFYMDPGAFWTERAKLFSDQQIKSFEEADKNSGKFLSGLELSKLLTEAGPYHRFVAVEQESASYKTTPKLHVPAFARRINLLEHVYYSAKQSAADPADPAPRHNPGLLG